MLFGFGDRTELTEAGADYIAESKGIGVGRGAAYVVLISGILLVATAVALPFMRSVKVLENNS